MSLASPPRAPLERSTTERMLAGVSGGLAEHLAVPVLWVRVGLLLGALLGGAGALLYLWLWATVPQSGETSAIVPLRSALTTPVHGAPRPRTPVAQVPVAGPAARAETAADRGPVPGPMPAAAALTPPDAPRRRLPVAELFFGACLLLVGVLLVLDRLGGQIRLEVVLPALAVLVGVGLTWWQIADRDRPDRNPVPRALAAVALVAVGVLMFFVASGQPSTWTVVVAAFAVLAGVALAIAPWLLRLNRELIAERAGREREAERAEIAAHLHDSVLQTLALIQQRSAPGSDVARLARGQERELRDWLFRAGDGGAPADRATAAEQLRAHAAALETDYLVRFDTVAVGADTSVPEAILAAAKEAMLNAARHAGGDVTVYAEVTPATVSIDVTDRGPGMDTSAIPEGRMGVRESILGRMARAGGAARIVAGPGGSGTSVRLSMPREQEAPHDE